MFRKIVAVWISLAMLFGFVVIVIEIAPKVTAYTPHDPFRINNDTEFASMAASEGWVGNGLPGNPYIIEGYDINGSGYGYCIYIGNTTVYFEVRDSYLHEASGGGSNPYYPDSGIVLYNVQKGTITNNTVSSNNWYGIYLTYSDSNTITNNTASNNEIGIYLYYSNSNTITNNTASSNNINGICLEFLCNSNTITNNTASHNDDGIDLIYSDSNTISNNNASSNNNRGIHLGVSHGNTIANNNASSNNGSGIGLLYSNSNTITNNNASNNNVGISISDSDSNTITNNNASNNNVGISISDSDSNTITNNTASSNSLWGIDLYYSDSHTITNNTASNNRVGINLDRSSSNTIFNNEMVKDGISIYGDMLEHWNSHNIDTNNTVNGKPVYYWKNQTGGTVPLDAGEVILANSNNVVIEKQNTSDGTVGILLGFSSSNTITSNTASSNNEIGISLYYSNSNTITNNTASNNDYGIYLWDSSSNTITNNNASSSNWNGIYLFDSPSNTIANNTVSSNNNYGIILSSSSRNNKIFHNNFNNFIQAYDVTSNGNQWDNGYPIGGNYWSDYSGFDNFKGPNQDMPGNDGIGDSPYVIDVVSQDNYPLMEPYLCNPLENYTVLKQGWNLISIPLIQNNQDLSKVLEMIDGWYDAVQWYDNSDQNYPWKHNKVGKPYGNDLFELNETIGFWIHITQPGDTIFLYNGTQPTQNQSILLHPGWNMVGYPSLTSYNRTEGLNNLTLNDQVDAIWSYDAATQKWEEMGESDYFQIGKGYYIHVKSECEWEVPIQ